VRFKYVRTNRYLVKSLQELLQERDGALKNILQNQVFMQGRGVSLRPHQTLLQNDPYHRLRGINGINVASVVPIRPTKAKAPASRPNKSLSVASIAPSVPPTMPIA
jgi:hypothetical protein